MHIPRHAILTVALLCLPVTTGCIERPDEELLRPPPELDQVLRRLGLQPSDKLAAEARRGSRELARHSARLTAPVLARAIRHAEAQAGRAGPRRIPAELGKLLAPHFAKETLDDARWTISRGRINLGTVITEQFMDEGAVALNRQIVFSNERLSRNLWMWAHELAHVEQYRRMGIDRFAAAYLADWQTIEREATDRANKVTAAIRKTG